MGQLWKITGILIAGYKLFGNKVTGAILDRVEYRFSSLKRQNIRLDIRDGKLLAYLRIQVLFKQSFGLNLTANQLRLNLRQQGQSLGQVTVNEPVNLPNALTVPIPVDIIISGGEFLERLSEILSNPNAKWQAPIDVQGTLTLSNGVGVPVFGQLDFLGL